MKGKQRKGLICAGGLFLILFCSAFFRSETTEKSMVRAVLLEQSEDGWSAGLLYQAPEGAADASKVSAEIRFCRAEGGTVAQALEEAERGLPQRADFRLCDHLLLGKKTDWSVFGEAESFILSTRQGRRAVFVVGADFEQRELEQEGEEEEKVFADLLDSLKELKKVSPRLYESRIETGLVLPLLGLEGKAVRIEETGILFTPRKRVSLEKNELQACYLLEQKRGTREFRIEGKKRVLPWGLVSVAVIEKGVFSVRLDGRIQTEEGESEEEADFFRSLLEKTIRMLWAEGVDLLDLSAKQALRTGEGKISSPPSLRVTVKLYPL